MISSIALEIEKWIAEHHGDRPKSVRVPKAVVDACADEADGLYFVKDVRYAGGGMKILGIPVLVDPTLTIGKIDP